MRVIGFKTSKRARAGVIIGVTAAGLGAAAVASASTSAPFSTATTPRCHTGGLSLSLLPETAHRHHGGGMNHQGATVALKNVGKHACHVNGYPGAAMRTAKGSIIAPARVVRGRTYYAADPKPHTFVLAPGKSAYAELGWTSADGTRPTAEAASIIVTPPNERTYRTTGLRTVLGGDRTITATALSAAPAHLPS
ncbi:DUF4232 domain-containing protein [Actinomadura barringtoniae]|uniref:DUF4232 domain-containing protein n=1 Tax=Actinomadura barringtoniae TaxID=1427535 RepID=A0A939PPP3_9ACTN|nr:DUF4232 domain-containing protein [Actinomadura barringtoniae]MBO2452416.1 DUF4232 domain-containing protein [Actinomadura barringtoniae]